MSAHEQFADDLALQALGSLEGEERITLEKHLETCAPCRGELEALRGDLSLLSLTVSWTETTCAVKAKIDVRNRRRASFS